MRTILILNPKGGSGKTTLSTNLAGFFACWGGRVTLVDFDPQASSLGWLAARPVTCPVIEGVAAVDGKLDIDRSTDHLILDVPSGYHGDELLPWFKRADKIIIPVLPSPHDIRAAEVFLQKLSWDERFADRIPSMGIIANRVKKNTRSFKLLKNFLNSVDIPCMGILRDTQNYVSAAQYGLSIFELPASEVRKDLLQWQRFIKWLCVDPFINSDVPVKPDQLVYEEIYGENFIVSE